MRAFTLIVAAVLSACGAAAAEPVSLVAEDGGVVHADRYGTGAHWVVLVHGARFDKASWGSQARALAEAGFSALAIDLRGYGRSGPREGSDLLHPGYPLDVLAAVRFARAEGAETVSLVGGSLGGWAAGQAAVDARPGEIDRLVLLAHASLDEPERMQGRKLFVVARGDVRGENVPRLPDIQEQFERAPEPKELLVLDGAAHAQHLFATDQGERLMREILRFLSAP
ncbi:MAG TPA: alpha/beta fold hydrolase [Thermoanaerobaculia bacterium]|nr:alpha/beta fold hydrolase [Thermoanaerobaculia bacterium]